MSFNERINKWNSVITEVVEYISENYISFLLLLLAIAVIYFTESIIWINTLTYGTVSAIPGVSNTLTMTSNVVSQVSQKKQKRKK